MKSGMKCVCSETIKSALRRETFKDGVELSLPRQVLMEVEERIEKRDDVSFEDVLQEHRRNR